MYMNCKQSEVNVSSTPVPVKLTTYCFRFIFSSIVQAIRNRVRRNVAVLKRRLVPRDIQ